MCDSALVFSVSYGQDHSHLYLNDLTLMQALKPSFTLSDYERV